jgi:hypothetical protein
MILTTRRPSARDKQRHGSAVFIPHTRPCRRSFVVSLVAQAMSDLDPVGRGSRVTSNPVTCTATSGMADGTNLAACRPDTPGHLPPTPGVAFVPFRIGPAIPAKLERSIGVGS